MGKFIRNTDVGLPYAYGCIISKTSKGIILLIDVMFCDNGFYYMDCFGYV